MQRIKFVIILTSPLVITADGDFSKETFAGNFSPLLQTGQIELERKQVSVQENERIRELQGDILAVAFTFITPISLLNTLCNDIANEIFKNTSLSPRLKILVEGTKSSSVITLSNIDAQELAKRIQDIVTEM